MAGEIILYTTEDGQEKIALRVENGSVWLTQAQLAELFQTTVSNINKHIREIVSDGEQPEATIEHYSIVRSEGGRTVERQVAHYNLPMILAIGFRVRSPRGVQFRRWAAAALSEYLAKGFVMDDERLKNPGGWDYFDELLARIREIRASEKRFYQKVRDLFALSSDYRVRAQETALFFAETQNKLLYAVTGHTAAELVVERADPGQPNMALMAWSGSRVRKQDVIVAKNYLSADEIDTLNRLVVIFLEQAELRVKQRQDLSLDFWRGNVDKMLAFNDQPILSGAGSVSHERMERVARERYALFDQQRRDAERAQADADDLKEIEQIEQDIKKLKEK